MTKYSRLGAMALVIGLGLALGACGSKDSASTASGTTATVTFESEPVSEVWIDGTSRGKTPLAIALSAGAHDITLKRAGFHELTHALSVEAGKDVTVAGTLPVAGSDEAALKRLVAMLGEKHEAFGKPRAHRGATSAVTLYFPTGDVRRSGLGTYRIEVDGSYDYDGFIEFRKGKKVVHREKFEPQTVITEKALPPTVLEAARNGARMSWGLTYEGKRSKDSELAKFNVIPKHREKKVAKDLDKLLKRRAIRASTPLLKEMAQIDYLKNRRLYSEVLVRSLGVLNTWQDTLMPYRNIVDVMQRLKLKDSSLYAFAASQVSGNPGRNLNNRPGIKSVADRGSPVKRSSEPLPPTATAPRVTANQPASGGLRPATGVTTRPSATESGSEASPDGSRDPASTELGTDAARRAAELDALRRDLREADLLAAHAEDAENLIAELDAALREEAESTNGLEQARDAAQAALTALEEADPRDEPAIREAREAFAAREEAASQARESLDQMRQDVARETEALRQQAGAAGSSEEARSTADELRRRLEGAQGASGTEIAPVVPTPLDPRAADRAAELAGQAFQAAQEAVQAAQGAAADAVTAAQGAAQAQEAAETAYRELENADPPTSAGDLQAAHEARDQANADAARAAMDAERANAALARATQDAEDARRAADAPVEGPGGG